MNFRIILIEEYEHSVRVYMYVTNNKWCTQTYSGVELLKDPEPLSDSIKGVLVPVLV